MNFDELSKRNINVEYIWLLLNIVVLKYGANMNNDLEP